MNGSDPTKKWQRNIRIPPELWDFVRSKAIGGDCSAVIRTMITKEKARHDASLAAGLQRTERCKARKAAKAASTSTEGDSDGHRHDHSPTDSIVRTDKDEASPLLPR